MAVAVVAVAFAAFAVLLATRKPVSLQTVVSPLLLKDAPPISGTTLSGDNFALSSYRGKFVLVNFFASWCTPCRQEERALVQLSRQTSNVQVVGVAFDDAASSASGFLKSYGAQYPAVQDPNGRIALEYGVSQPPQSYLVAPNGKILTEIIGPVSFVALEKLIAVAKSKGY